MDEDPGRDGHVGKGSAKLSTFMQAESLSEWFEIEHKGNLAGKVHLKSEWTPKHEKHGLKKFLANHVEIVHEWRKVRNEFAKKVQILSESFYFESNNLLWHNFD